MILRSMQNCYVPSFWKRRSDLTEKSTAQSEHRRSSLYKKKKATESLLYASSKTATTYGNDLRGKKAQAPEVGQLVVARTAAKVARAIEALRISNEDLVK